MSTEDRDKWNKRYAEDSYRKSNPVTLLEDWIPQVPVGRALDVACGAGRNSIFMAQSGYDVDAIDISHQGLDKARQNAESQGFDINWMEHDLDQPYEFESDYNLIVVMWYVNLPLITQLCDKLAPGGYLLCEEHLLVDEDVIGPTSPNYRVTSGALRDAINGPEILLYEESIETNAEDDRVASARVVAKDIRA
ncbi:MAG: methyltransferase domain-containing protein [Gammaproteobacteria bacterium]|nr:methyltransferase domain-containing protein [Gammaproteobacteria bacterium]